MRTILLLLVLTTPTIAFSRDFDAGNLIDLMKYRENIKEMSIIEIYDQYVVDNAPPPVKGYNGTQIWFSHGAENPLTHEAFTRFPSPIGDTVISNYAGTLNIDKNGNHPGDGAVLNIAYHINHPAKKWDSPRGGQYNSHFGTTGNCVEDAIENKGSVYCLSNQLFSSSYGGPIKTDANLFSIRPPITDGHGIRSQISALNSGVIDQTNLPSSQSGGIEAAEIDLYANKPDDAHDRVALIVASSQQNEDKYTNLEVGDGILLRAAAYTYYDSSFQIMGAYKNAALDLRYANTSCPNNTCAPALWIGELEPIAFSRENPDKIKIFGDYSGNIHFVSDYNDNMDIKSSGDVHIKKSISIGKSFILEENNNGNFVFYAALPDERKKEIMEINSTNILFHMESFFKSGIIISNMKTKEILGIERPKEGEIINDSEIHQPVIYENGHWYPIDIGRNYLK
ncbi:MAG: hypothetical protein ABF665_07210 [Gluconacetobacter sp.]